MPQLRRPWGWLQRRAGGTEKTTRVSGDGTKTAAAADTALTDTVAVAAIEGKTMKALAKEVGIRRFGESDARQTADIGDESDMIAFHRKFYEDFQWKYYPRPALLGDRVVFSYQPYDKGCFAEGILHFALPYSLR